MMAVAISAAIAKNIITLTSPSISSPMSLAKPITWTLICGVSAFERTCSRFCASSYLARIFSSSTFDRPS